MERIFWVVCPHCGFKFYCDYALRRSKILLICPSCHNEFLDEASAGIDERA